jgi:hypothetical protein
MYLPAISPAGKETEVLSRTLGFCNPDDKAGGSGELARCIYSCFSFSLRTITHDFTGNTRLPTLLLNAPHNIPHRILKRRILKPKHSSDFGTVIYDRMDN